MHLHNLGSTAQQDPMTKVNVVLSHGQLPWLVEVGTVVLFIKHGLSLYHFSIQPNQFSYPEDEGSTFL
jgi:hypothetical protein